MDNRSLWHRSDRFKQLEFIYPARLAVLEWFGQRCSGLFSGVCFDCCLANHKLRCNCRAGCKVCIAKRCHSNDNLCGPSDSLPTRALISGAFNLRAPIEQLASLKSALKFAIQIVLKLLLEFSICQISSSLCSIYFLHNANFVPSGRFLRAAREPNHPDRLGQTSDEFR